MQNNVPHNEASHLKSARSAFERLSMARNVKELVLSAYGELGLVAPDLEELLLAYASPGRHYHTLGHILFSVESLVSYGFASNEAILALAYHDVVFDTRDSNNESLSAGWARRDLESAGASEAMVREIVAAIMATDHKTPITTTLQAWVVDADLAILGTAPSVYQRYSTAIREEYAWVDARSFALGRSGFLKTMLARPSIYCTSEFQGSFEKQALCNLKNELATLGASESEVGRG